ncbi:MAG: nitroreductase family protein [Candidatus Krumholzibacteriia bacterium]
MRDHDTMPLPPLPRYDDAESVRRAAGFRDFLATRRSVRSFSDRPVPPQVITACVEAAGQAPSGANKQPWRFEIVGDPDVKREIRLAAEEEERAFYGGRAGEQWLADLEPFGTDWRKPFLETAPWLIAVFEQRHGTDTDGGRVRHYYTRESVGLACGFLLAALHHAGLATLTHTPSPMHFLNGILGRPTAEKPFLLLVVGHPADDATVPRITRKPPDLIMGIR